MVSVRLETDAYDMNNTVCSAFLDTVAANGQGTALRWRHRGDWETLTWSQTSDRVASFAGRLIEMGVKPGDRVALMIGNRPEFHIADLAVLFCGATPVSLYQTSSPEQIADSKERTNAGLLITEDLAQFIDELDGEPIDLHVAATKVTSDDMATIIFTSGTTTKPKGVVLTHANVVALMEGIRGLIGVELSGKRVVSYLPLAHIAERALSYYLPVFSGMAVTTCPDPSRLASHLTATRPHLFFGVPRVWEKLYSSAQRSLARQPLKHKALDIIIGSNLLRKRLGGPLLKKLQAQMGLDEVLFAASGAAPISESISEWFRSIGVPFSEIYGMSETTGPITWSPHGHRPGTVGRPIPGMEICLLPDGEVAVRGRTVFSGYLDDPTATAAAFYDGWFCTGDIGVIGSDGQLSIVDRKKDLIITTGGKNISPAALESALMTSPLVAHACVIGDRRAFLSAVIAVDGVESAAGDLKDLIDAHVKKVNAGLSRVEHIKRVVIVDNDWKPDSELLTATLKVKRSGVESRYHAEIENIYSVLRRVSVIPGSASRATRLGAVDRVDSCSLVVGNCGD